MRRPAQRKLLTCHYCAKTTWNTHIDTLVRRAKQCLDHLGQLRKVRISQRILKTFYAGAVESILTEHHCLLLSTGGLCECGAFGSAHYCHYIPHPAGPVLQEVSTQSLQDHEGSSPAQQHTVPTPVTLLEQRD